MTKPSKDEIAERELISQQSRSAKNEEALRDLLHGDLLDDKNKAAVNELAFNARKFLAREILKGSFVKGKNAKRERKKSENGVTKIVEEVKREIEQSLQNGTLRQLKLAEALAQQNALRLEAETLAPVLTQLQDAVLKSLKGGPKSQESLRRELNQLQSKWFSHFTSWNTTLKDAMRRLKKLGFVDNKPKSGYYLTDKGRFIAEKSVK
ncbi:MAG: hypothetical protein ABI041_03620 [Bdellovibrionia bacterium]